MLALTSYQTEFVHELLNARIAFLVVGGRAMQAHGIDRATRDLDIWISRGGDNPERVYPVLAKRMEIPSPRLNAHALRGMKKLICLPSAEAKEVDVLTSLGALDFELASSAGVDVDYGGASFRVLGLPELVYSKTVSATCNESPQARARDVADLDLLLELWRKRHNPALNQDAQQAGFARSLRAG